ncbi:hypothetical protein BDR03DRAFT_1019193 [Suillus americanus]|nr:hypothetical protein BDR03DRAFT_1019193 [Suillus americanus]
MNCHRLKAACSLTGKGKEKSSSPPSPTPPPPNPSTSAATSGPTAGAGPAPKATGGDKSADLPPRQQQRQQHPAPVPFGIQRAYVEIPVVDLKRKVAALEPESSDAEDEDAYMAGRLDGLNTFVSMLESTLGALKKEVTDIDTYMTQKRRRRRRRLQ